MCYTTFTYLQKHRNNTACQMIGNICALSLHDKTHPACRAMKALERFTLPRLFFPDNYKPESLKDVITNVYHINHR